MKKAKSFIVLVLLSFGVNAHYDDGYLHDSNTTVQYKDWMVNLSDKLSIDRVSILGTHDSGSLYGGDIVQTQSMSIANQLNAGVRFLDIRLRHINDVFAIHHDLVFQNQFFGDVLNQAEKFLSDNPTEFILMRIKKEYTEEGNTRRFDETLADYINRYSSIIYAANNGYSLPSVAEVRGKVVMLDDTGTYPPVGIRYDRFSIQDEYKVASNWGLYSKWEKVKMYLTVASRGQRGIINYLSGSTDGALVLPYFVASGHSSPSTGAPRLATGLTTPGWSGSYPDFPRVSCFIGICTIAFEGTNTLSKNWINNNKPNYTGIVAADFIGSGLIKAVIDSNYRQ
ncbi:phosphatidylinositol-specific phospholipase C [Aeromonas cavernicola]|uniref:1-phosphatidylinositol phosphodiesterase n=1 Tax=Aeromonas cavernicola TaxID=1006623 RepID=A0A2H9U3S4_9GAMM|nr:phosphatidylinositol-specific phospholipase C [Aeromonas cavernicola]PJG58680.1 phospholipase [Aeromonas cavernicola]